MNSINNPYHNSISLYNKTENLNIHEYTKLYLDNLNKYFFQALTTKNLKKLYKLIYLKLIID